MCVTTILSWHQTRWFLLKNLKWSSASLMNFPCSRFYANQHKHCYHPYGWCSPSSDPVDSFSICIRIHPKLVAELHKAKGREEFFYHFLAEPFKNFIPSTFNPFLLEREVPLSSLNERFFIISFAQHHRQATSTQLIRSDRPKLICRWPVSISTGVIVCCSPAWYPQVEDLKVLSRRVVF